jgi:hypothetical protein
MGGDDVEALASRLLEFDVDVSKRYAIHKPSGISFAFNRYPSEDDWKAASPKSFRDRPDWDADRMELAKAAKRAALAAGMKAQ